MEQKQLPDLPEEIDHVSYLDGMACAGHGLHS